jgi:hypothetical protein
MSRHVIGFVLLVLTLSFPPSACGGVIPIGPFRGSLSENFDALIGGQGGHPEVTILGGYATVRVHSGDGSMKVEYYSNLGGRAVAPHSPPVMMGQICVSEWDFDRPVTAFGAYFANNSRFDDARFDFYGEDGGLIDSVAVTVPNSGVWSWHGWKSSVPIKLILITGNDEEFLNGFIWFDDVQVTPSPIVDPASPEWVSLPGTP